MQENKLFFNQILINNVTRQMSQIFATVVEDMFDGRRT